MQVTLPRYDCMDAGGRATQEQLPSGYVTIEGNSQGMPTRPLTYLAGYCRVRFTHQMVHGMHPTRLGSPSPAGEGRGEEN